MNSETPNQQLKRLLKGVPSNKRKSRLGVAKLKVDGVSYDSKAEIRYENKLKLLVGIGEITGYDYHVRIPLIADGGVLVGHYEADFIVYYPDGRQQTHDVKGNYESDLFHWKARHYKAQYGNEIILIDSTTLQPKAR